MKVQSKWIFILKHFKAQINGSHNSENSEVKEDSLLQQ